MRCSWIASTARPPASTQELADRSGLGCRPRRRGADRGPAARRAARRRRARRGGRRTTGASGLEWVVDPLDGTVNFLYGIPQWAVSIACRDAGGHARRGRSRPAARRDVQRRAGRRLHLNGRTLRIGAPPPLARALVGTGFSYVAAERQLQTALFARVLPCARDIRRAGSAALDLAWVAAGPPRRLLRARAGRMGSRGGRPARARGRWSRACPSRRGRPARRRARRAGGAGRRARAAAAPGSARMSAAPCPAGRRSRSRARPRPGPARRRHGPVGDPLRRARRAARRSSASACATSAPSPRTRSRRSTRATRAPSTWTRSSSSAARSPSHVEARCEAGELPLVLGGDHSLALGVFGGLARVHGPVGDDLVRRARRLQHARDDARRATSTAWA